MIVRIVETISNNIASKKNIQATFKLRHLLRNFITVFPEKSPQLAVLHLLFYVLKMFNYEKFKLELTLYHVENKTMQRNQINKIKNTLMHACFDDKEIRQK